MNTTLWIIQATLGAMMIMLGLMKTFTPVDRLNRFSWTMRNSTGFIRFVGISELLIGLGLILPQLTNILPILTTVAALALGFIMIMAIADHVKYNETHEIWKNAIILVLASFVALGRFYSFQL